MQAGYLFFLILICVSVYVRVCVHAGAHVLSEDSFMGVSFLGIFLSLIKACHELRNSMFVE